MENGLFVFSTPMKKISASFDEELLELDNPLRAETRIVFLFERSLFPFLREGFDLTHSRTRPPKKRRDGALVVAFAMTRQGDLPIRRVWTIRPGDFRSGASNVPSEAVDPLELEPTHPSRKTARCSAAPTDAQRAAIERIWNAQSQVTRRARAQVAARKRRSRKKQKRAFSSA